MTTNNGGPIGNLKHQIHGGAAAERHLSTGQPFTGLAAGAQAEVSAELDKPGGRVAIVRMGAERLEAAARLFWAAMEKAAAEGDIERVDKLAARFGWLQNSAIRAMQVLKAELKGHEDALDPDYLKQFQEAKNDTTDPKE